MRVLHKSSYRGKLVSLKFRRNKREDLGLGSQLFKIGDQCPMHTSAVDEDNPPIWKRIRAVYDRMRAMMQKDANKQTLWDRIRSKLRK